uniref:Uncharacterized protein n=1 Tax=Arundo donax TaxID=35708 RepID=A0A0A9BUI9_ARUDO
MLPKRHLLPRALLSPSPRGRPGQFRRRRALPRPRTADRMEPGIISSINDERRGGGREEVRPGRLACVRASVYTAYTYGRRRRRTLWIYGRSRRRSPCPG